MRVYQGWQQPTDAARTNHFAKRQYPSSMAEKKEKLEQVAQPISGALRRLELR